MRTEFKPVYKWFLVAAAVTVSAISIASYAVLTNSNRETEDSVETAVVTARNVEEMYVVEALTRTKLSPTVQEEIFTSMKSSSAKWGVPLSLLHAFIVVESNYQFWVKHPTVTVTAKGRRVTTHAIGLGGIMYVFWGDSLAAHGIAQAESDLYIPSVNIEAMAYILSGIAKGATEESAIRTLVRKYYGAYDAGYEARLRQVMSEMWLRGTVARMYRDTTSAG